MKRFEKFAVFAAFVLALSVLSSGQVTLPYTFTTSVPVAQLNSNFSTLGTGALNRAGGTLTGNITANAGVTIDGVDVGALLSGGSGTLATGSLTTSSASATSIDAAGGITAGTGNVGIVDTTGKIPALSSTYLANLSATNLTISGTAISTYIWTSGTYTPTWAGGGPTIGNGTLTGKWQKTGKTVTVQIYLVGGSTTTWGGAGWTFSLPETAATDGVTYMGVAQALDTGTAYYTGQAAIASGGTTMLMHNTSSWSNTVPFTWATGDSIAITITYQSAA